MKEKPENTVNVAERERELSDFIRWSFEHPNDWRRLCQPDSYAPTGAYLLELVQMLYEKKLFSVVYLVLFSHWEVDQVDEAIRRTTGQCMMDVPAAALMDRFLQNLRACCCET